MGTPSRILAFGLLSLYAIILLHNAVPHLHVGQSLQADAVGHIEHNHAHTEHHHEHETTGAWLHTLLSLLGDFFHQDVGPNHFENYVGQGEQKVNVQPTVQLLAVCVVAFELVSPATAADYAGTDPPPLLYDPPTFLSDPLRGPPAVA